MSKQNRNQKNIQTVIALLVILGLVSSAVLLFISTTSLELVSKEVWSHFKSLSLLVIGYLFSSRAKP